MNVCIERSVRAIKHIFRTLDEEAYAAEFVQKGSLQISTLEGCRQAEVEGRRDEQEGYLTRHLDMTIPDDPRADEVFAESGAFNRTPVGSTFENSRIVTYIDAFVLCFTERYSPVDMAALGGHWICVENPVAAFERLTKRIMQKFDVLTAMVGPVRYSGRDVEGLDHVKWPVPFCKPEDGYTNQQEIRMVWEVDDKHRPLHKFILDCPEIAELCARINGDA